MAGLQKQLAALDASRRIVVLSGKELFFIEEATRVLDAALRDTHGVIDRFAFDGERAALADILDELRSLALMQTHKLVIVDAADAFLAGGEGRRRAIERYAASPTPEATLLLRATTWRAGKLDKLIDAVGVRIKCEPLRDGDAIGWCEARAREKHRCTIERDAARLLVGRLGTDLCRLDTELAKLEAYAPGAGVIDSEAVSALVGRSRQEKAWVLQSAILSGRPEVAGRAFRELVDVSRVPEELIMWSIGDLVRRLHTAARMLAGGSPPATLRSRLRLFGEDGHRLIEVARRLDPRNCAQLLRQVVQVDRETKRGLGRARRNLEALTLSVTDRIGCGTPSPVRR